MRPKLGVYCLLLITAVAIAATMTLDDKELAKRLVGTWLTDPSEPGPMVSRATYKADGTGTEVVWRRGDRESVGVRVTTRWSVTNEVLYITSTGSSDAQKIPVGIHLKDRIISITADKLVFEALDGYGEGKGKRATKIRRKDA